MAEKRRLYSVNSVNKPSNHPKIEYNYLKYSAVEIPKEKKSSYLMLNGNNYNENTRNSYSVNKNLSLVEYIDNLKEEYNYNRNDIKNNENNKNKNFSNKKINMNYNQKFSQKRSINKVISSVSNSKYTNKFDLNFGENYNTINYTQKLTENSYLRRFSKGEKPQIVNVGTKDQNVNIYTVNKFDNNALNNPNLKTSKHKLSNIIVPTEHRFSCNYIDHNLVSHSYKLSYQDSKNLQKNPKNENYNNDIPEEIDTTNDYCKNKDIKLQYSSETIVNIFANLLANNKFAIPQVFTKSDKEYIFSEIGIPIPKKLEHLREKKFLNKQAIKVDDNLRKTSAYNYNPKFSIYQAKPQNNVSGNYENSNSHNNTNNYSNNKTSFYYNNHNNSSTTNTNKTNNLYTNSNQARKSRINSSTYEYNNANLFKSKFNICY